MNRYTVIFHTPADINDTKVRFWSISGNAISMDVTAADVEEAVAKAHDCVGYGHYEHVMVIDGLSVVAEYRHRVSVSKKLDRII